MTDFKILTGQAICVGLTFGTWQGDWKAGMFAFTLFISTVTVLRTTRSLSE